MPSVGVCKYVWILSGHDVLVLVSVSWPVAANEQVSGDDGEDQLAICTLPPPFIILQASLLISAARESYNAIMLRYVDCYVIDLEPGSCVRIETTHCATPRLASPCSGPDITIIILPWTGATSFG